MTVNFRGLIGSGLIGCLALASSGTGESQERVRVQEGTEVRTASGGVHRVSVLVGASARVHGGASIGRIEDIVINEHGCIDYVVLGVEERFILVPWSVATVDFGQRFVTIGIERDRLLQAPSFTRTQWTTIGDVQFTQRVNTFFGVKSTRREGGEAARERTGTRERTPASQPGEQPGRPKEAPDRAREPERTPPTGRDRPKDPPKDVPKETPKDAPKPKTPPKDKEKDKP